MIVHDELAVHLRGRGVGHHRVVGEPLRPAAGHRALGRPPDLPRLAAGVVRRAESDARDDQGLLTLLICMSVLRRLAALVGKVDARAVESGERRVILGLLRFR